MYIYKITNKINNKCYIGQTIRPIEQRFNRHINDAMNNNLDTHFARAIRKYGPENFSIEIIDESNNQCVLNWKEQYWIQKYDSINNGYNETDALFKSGGNTYLSKSNDEMDIIRSKIRDSKLGSNNPNSRRIKCLNINTMEEIFFDTIENCKIYFGEQTHRFITTRVTGQTYSLYNNEWLISYIENDYSDNYKKLSKSGTIIKVINLKEFTEETFYSIRKLSEAMNINRNVLIENAKESKDFIIGYYRFIILN